MLVGVMALTLGLSIVAIGIVMATTGESRSCIKNQSDYGGYESPLWLVNRTERHE